MSEFLDGLERDLVDAARRRRDARRAATVLRLRERVGLRRVALAVTLCALVGSATAAATFAVLRGSVIPGPAARDVPREQLPAPGTARVSELRAADPEPGHPSWTLRVARGSTGLLCSTVGQVLGGRFGLIGLDGRFRTYAEQEADSCGTPLAGPHASLVGARVFDADRLADVRTVVNGVGGEQLRSVELIAIGGSRRTADGAGGASQLVSRRVAVGEGGTFLAVLRGYPEDRAVEVVLRFAGGRVEWHGFGRSPGVVPDPLGGRAWRLRAGIMSGDPRTCVSFSPARGWGGTPRSPAVCGMSTARGMDRDGYFFGVRRMAPGDGGREAPGDLFTGAGDWGEKPARTAVWGAAGRAVERIEVDGPAGRTTLRPNAGQTFLALFDGAVEPAALTVRVVFADGRVEIRRGDANLVEKRSTRR